MSCKDCRMTPCTEAQNVECCRQCETKCTSQCERTKTKRYIESTYRESKSKQLLFEITGETPTEYICKFIDRGETIQNADKPHYIRKILIGAIYKLIEEQAEERVEQISLFEFL